MRGFKMPIHISNFLPFIQSFSSAASAKQIIKSCFGLYGLILFNRMTWLKPKIKSFWFSVLAE